MAVVCQACPVQIVSTDCCYQNFIQLARNVHSEKQKDSGQNADVLRVGISAGISSVFTVVVIVMRIQLSCKMGRCGEKFQSPSKELVFNFTLIQYSSDGLP